MHIYINLENNNIRELILFFILMCTNNMHSRRIEKTKLINQIRDKMSDEEIDNIGMVDMPTEMLHSVCKGLKVKGSATPMERFQDVLLAHSTYVRAAAEKGLDPAIAAYNKHWPDTCTKLAHIVDETIEGSIGEMKLTKQFDMYVAAMEVELCRSTADQVLENLTESDHLSDSDEDSEQSFKGSISNLQLDENLPNVRMM